MYHNGRNSYGKNEDVKEFCNAPPIEQDKELEYVLIPGLYVSFDDEEDDFDFKERFITLITNLKNDRTKKLNLTAGYKVTYQKFN